MTDLVFAAPDALQSVVYLAQSGDGEAQATNILNNVGTMIRNLGIIVLGIMVVLVGIKAGGYALGKSAEGGGVFRKAASDLSGLLIAGVIIGGGAILVGVAMDVGSGLGG